MQTHIIEVAWNEYEQRLAAIRREVFVVEQQVPAEEEWDGLDDEAHHFLAINAAESNSIVYC